MQSRGGVEIWDGSSALGKASKTPRLVARMCNSAEHTEHACLSWLFIGRHGKQCPRLGQKAVCKVVRFCLSKVWTIKRSVKYDRSLEVRSRLRRLLVTVKNGSEMNEKYLDLIKL